MKTFIGKLGTAALPALIVIGIGILEIKFPSAMKGFDDGYTGHGTAGLILLLIELFLALTWGKNGGIVLIALTIAVLIIYLFSEESTVEAPEQLAEELTSEVSEQLPINLTKAENSNSSDTVKQELFRLGVRAGKNFIERRRNKQMKDELQ